MKSDVHMNRTGVATAPDKAAETLEGAVERGPSSEGDATALAAARAPYVAEGEPVGSNPPSVSKQAPDVFMDKLGDRLAFERSGTRLYQTMLGKLMTAGEVPGGPTAADIQHIMLEEHRHFQLVSTAITQLGGDPTVETPMADLTGVASTALAQIVSDPRTTIEQSLHALLVAELTDNDGWYSLIKLANGLGHTEMATQFQGAFEREQEHLANVRGWCEMLAQQQAGISAKASGRGKQPKA